MKELIKEALNAGWSDRLFYYYKQEVDVNAIRPQDENSQEWKDIIAKLETIATPKPVPTPRPAYKEGYGAIPPQPITTPTPDRYMGTGLLD